MKRYFLEDMLLHPENKVARDKVDQIGSQAVEELRGDLVKTIKAIRCLLERLRVEVEDNRRKSPGPSQVVRISDEQEAYCMPTA